MTWVLQRVGVVSFLLAMLCLFDVSRVQAQGNSCRLALILALDSSSSIDAAEYEAVYKRYEQHT